ncbi:MAG: RICIN domain-containing protein [Spirochaetia bacterium]
MRKTRLLFFLVLFIILAAGIFAQRSDQARGLDVVGYGYNVFGHYADMRSLMPYRLFDLGDSRTQPIGAYEFQVPEAVNLQNISRHNVTTVEGEDLREYSQSMSVEAGLSADAMFFSASIDTAFSRSTEGTSRHYFYTYRDANIKWRISLDTRSIPGLRERLTSQARYDINNMEPRELFRNYGAYYVANAYLGGRAELNVTVDESEVTNMRDLSVAVEARYQAITANVSTSTSSSETNASSIENSSLTVVGGNSEYANDIRNPEQYEMWASGIQDWPVLCEFETGSLRPIWELADSPQRRSELRQVFDEMKEENPLPPAFVDILAMENEILMFQNVGTGKYWDMPGYNTRGDADAGDDIQLYNLDAAAARDEGIDRVIRIIANEYESDWVCFQPQNTENVARVNESEGIIELGSFNLRDHATQFKMEPVDGADDTYYFISRSTGLFLAAEREGNQSRIVLQEQDGSNMQQWQLRSIQREAIAQPDEGQYAIGNPDNNNYWDYSGVYPMIRNMDVQLWSRPGRFNPDRVIRLVPIENGDFRLMRVMAHPTALLTAHNRERLRPERQTRNHNQQWRFLYAGEPNTYYIVSRSGEGAIDASASQLNENGCRVQTWDYHGGRNQMWVVERVPDVRSEDLLYVGQYQVRTARGNYVLELSGNERETNRNGAEIQVWSHHNASDTRVRFRPLVNGAYIIEFQNGGRVMDVQGADNDNGTNIHLWQRHGRANQQWFLENMGDGLVRFRSADSNKVMDISGGSSFERGDDVHLWRPHGGISQRWRIIHADGPRNGRPF